MKVERITFERSGGFAGMHNVVNIDPRDLPKEQAEALLERLDELDFDKLPAQAMKKPSMPDEITYRITVETKDGEHTVVTGDTSAPEEMQELIQMLSRIARKQAQNKK
ncbi:MAG TPA: protealysin inhibitor emfourin [Anaerolineales bacterium]